MICQRVHMLMVHIEERTSMGSVLNAVRVDCDIFEII